MREIYPLNSFLLSVQLKYADVKANAYSVFIKTGRINFIPTFVASRDDFNCRTNKFHPPSSRDHVVRC